MSVKFHEATRENRTSYYNEEWRIKDVPDYILETLSKREFGFDHDGTGPKDRYNRFESPEALAEFLQKRAPYAVYCSVSFYEKPQNREGWEEAELVFDIDAKELTIKSCCKIGEVCEICLDNAKNVAMEVVRLMREDLALEGIYTSYSGRGYHIRVHDKDIMPQDSEVRANIFDYVRDRMYTSPKDMQKPPALLFDEERKVKDVLERTVPFSNLTKEIMKTLIRDGTSERLILNVPGIGKTTADKIFGNSQDIMEWMDNNSVKELRKLLGPKNTQNFLEHVYMGYINLMDAKVTVDTKRILRLPSSLHSKISRKCIHVEDLKNFKPEHEAVPKFTRDEK
ncbi:DNA primase catalytic subunit PriS [archaeon]|nr:DNA primase catalytic subunit PriS [archaeon]